MQFNWSNIRALLGFFKNAVFHHNCRSSYPRLKHGPGNKGVLTAKAGYIGQTAGYQRPVIKSGVVLNKLPCKAVQSEVYAQGHIIKGCLFQLTVNPLIYGYGCYSHCKYG